MSVGTSGAQKAPRARDVRGTTASPSRRGDLDAAAEADLGAESGVDPVAGLGALGIDPDDLPDGLVVADEHGRVICFNAAAPVSPPSPPPRPSGAAWSRRSL